MGGRPEEADPDALHTIAAFYWARSLAHEGGTFAARDLETAISVFGLLYLVDHRRVPRELWPRLADETGYDPWSDPLEHAADLVVGAEEAALALEAARSRWGAGHGTPWWWAADAYVEAGRHALIDVADGMLFSRACAVADEQIAVLRDSGRAEDVAELAETLFAAGLLRVSPYLGNMSGLSFESAHDLWRKRQARHRSVHPDDSVAPETAEMPPPLVAAEEAVRYLREAADLSREHERGRVLKALAEALSMVAGLKQESHDEEIPAAAREAFDLLDPVRDPLTHL
ncbi:hypothetical protein EEJ42_21455 [Streptomyces botrytidirepellens]|uniref:Uncharacterized protein n=1 Tax=Streptomyces botrytidirepellens TaxID=2486417 RepID=A0A3M8VWA2_9ACTN|nr:hypothetical protein EEJ42_21455 [Streptomyces botrytidirepellens]